MNPRVAQALESLRQGRFILIFDAEGREGETDLTVASTFIRRCLHPPASRYQWLLHQLQEIAAIILVPQRLGQPL